MTRFWLGIAAAIVTIPGIVQAQDQEKKQPPPPPPQEFFRLDFVVKEVEGGKTINTHTYQMMVVTAERERSSIRSGARVPVTTAGNSTTSYTYIDVGMNIDVTSVKRVKDELSMDVTGEISGAVDERTPPVIRQARWSSSVLVPTRKPTVLFASDDPSSKRQMVLEVTATPIH